ncbi:hypothetical protein FRC10_001133 [Ceratobasidium sp. 414]|nr:hypothetical protein FRC10_001133 [Ceratobasidium sp. 414]
MGLVAFFSTTWSENKSPPAPNSTHKPPLVNRSMMERLGMYDDPELIDAEWMHRHGSRIRHSAGRSRTAPLLVTALPDSKPPKHKYVSNALADWKLCGSTTRPCQVVLVRLTLDWIVSMLILVTQPASIGEQETKAQAHLQQSKVNIEAFSAQCTKSEIVALIARSLNRTLVLPNMSKSRFGACSQNRFDLYYEVKSLEALGVRVVSYEAFLEWCAARRTPPQAQTLEMMSWEQHLLQPASFSQSSAWRRCLRKAAPRLDWTRNGTRFAVHDIKEFVSSDRSIVDVIQRNALADLSNYPDMDELDIPQVYALSWTLRHPLHSEAANRHLTYANGIVQFADRLLDTAGPIAVIHWRMESAPPMNLVACSKGLIEILKWMSFQDRLKDVRLAYLATDYPLENNATRRSGTFHDIGEQHHTAINTLRKAFESGGVLESFKLVSYHDLARLVPHAEHVLETDPGFVGIMDKVIAGKADIFIRGSGQCARNSSFTKQIRTTRWQSLQQGPTKARSVEFIFQPLA